MFAALQCISQRDTEPVGLRINAWSVSNYAADLLTLTTHYLSMHAASILLTQSSYRVRESRVKSLISKVSIISRSEKYCNKANKPWSWFSDFFGWFFGEIYPGILLSWGLGKSRKAVIANQYEPSLHCWLMKCQQLVYLTSFICMFVFVPCSVLSIILA